MKRRQQTPLRKAQFKADELGENVTPEVREYCEQYGLLRYEVSLKARELADRGLQSMMGWLPVTEDGMSIENVIYGHFAQVLTLPTPSRNFFEFIGGRLLGKVVIAFRAFVGRLRKSPYDHDVTDFPAVIGVGQEIEA